MTRHMKILFAIATLAMASCVDRGGDGPYAPGVDHRKDAVDGIEVGNRLLAAGQPELALESFTRAALDQGMNAEILIGVGTANLALGRLGQAETYLRRATEAAPDWPEAWNNLGVLLMETGKTVEAEQIFQKAYALDNGQSDSIRDNLRLALSKSDHSAINDVEGNDYKLVRRGGSQYQIRQIP